MSRDDARVVDDHDIPVHRGTPKSPSVSVRRTFPVRQNAYVIGHREGDWSVIGST